MARMNDENEICLQIPEAHTEGVSTVIICIRGSRTAETAELMMRANDLVLASYACGAERLSNFGE